jgi:hypothetical protein
MLAFTARSQEDYSAFYAKRDASLKSESGWLNLAIPAGEKNTGHH